MLLTGVAAADVGRRSCTRVKTHKVMRPSPRKAAMALGCGSCMLTGAPSSVANTGHEAPIVGAFKHLAWRNSDVEALSETDARCGHRHDRGGVPRRRLCRTARLLSAGTDGLQQPVLQQRLLQSRTCSITVWLYHGDRNEPRPERVS